MTRSISLAGAQAILTFPTRGTRWQSKLAIGAALCFAGFIIPILPGIVFTGYLSTLMRQVILTDEDPVLPEWEDWGGLFQRGLRAFGAVMIFLLPAIVLMIGGYLVMIVPTVAAAFSQARSETFSVAAFMMQMAGSLLGTVMFIMGWILALASWIFLPAVWGRVVEKDSFTAAFSIGAWWRIFRANLSGFFTSLVLFSGLYLVMILAVQVIYVTVVLCFLLPFVLSVVSAYLGVVATVAMAEAYRDGMRKLAAS